MEGKTATGIYLILTGKYGPLTLERDKKRIIPCIVKSRKGLSLLFDAETESAFLMEGNRNNKLGIIFTLSNCATPFNGFIVIHLSGKDGESGKRFIFHQLSNKPLWIMNCSDSSVELSITRNAKEYWYKPGSKNQRILCDKNRIAEIIFEIFGKNIMPPSDEESKI